MKAKKISMTISVSLFVLGLLLAFCFTLINVVSYDLKPLLINLSIGIATGGLVAVLIEFPFAFAQIGNNKQLLSLNSIYIYMCCIAFTDLIDKTCQDEKAIVQDKVYDNLFQQIVQFATPLVSLDPHIYFCACKRKQIYRFTWTIHNFIMQRNSFDLNLQNKIRELKIKNFEAKLEIIEKSEQAILSGQFHQSWHNGSNDDPQYVTTSKDVKDELQEIKNKILSLWYTIDNTMNIVLSKKELQKWQREKQLCDHINVTIN